MHWEQYWDCQPCSHPDRTGDLRSVLKIADFYSARQWRSTGMYTEFYRPQGLEHELQLCLPEGSPRTIGPGRTVRATAGVREAIEVCEQAIEAARSASV